VRRAAAIALALAAAGCGGASGPQTSPSTPVLPTTDVAGTWTQVSGPGTRTWNLSQASIQIAGQATHADSNHPTFGPMSTSGGVVGFFLLGSLQFAETYERLVVTDSKYAFCYIDTSGTLAINGNTMTGSYAEVDGCAGVHVGQRSGTITMQRR
jgi:hypothetical protein